MRLDLPEPEAGRSQIGGLVVGIDRFGNVATNLRREQLDRFGLEPGARVEVRIALDRYYAFVAETFADATAAS